MRLNRMFLVLFFAELTLLFTDVEGQSLCQTQVSGTCLDPATSCCGGELHESANLCLTAGDNMRCCQPEGICGQELYNLQGVCIPAGRTKCDPPYKGICPSNKICCGPLSEGPDFVEVGTTPSTGTPGPPRPPGRPGPPRPPGPINPPPTNEVVCSYAGQKDACDVLADNLIHKLTGPELVAARYTTVGDDNSSPYNNLKDTCDGYEIQTTTSPQICKGVKLCLHENVPRFLRCFRRLCGAFTTLNIASDSNGPRWQDHCKGNAVDVLVPVPCRGRDKEVKNLCRALDGEPALYKSGRPGILDVLNCVFSR